MARKAESDALTTKTWHSFLQAEKGHPAESQRIIVTYPHHGCDPEMPDTPSCVNWNSIAPDRQEASEQPPCPKRQGIFYLTQIWEHEDLGLVPFATTKLQEAAEGGRVVTSNLRWPRSHWNTSVQVNNEDGVWYLGLVWLWFFCCLVFFWKYLPQTGFWVIQMTGKGLKKNKKKPKPKPG